MDRTSPHRPSAPGVRPAMSGRGGVRLGIALATLCINIWILAHFHDQFWWPPDEGNYAHVAERVLDGEVLHADVQDIHPGYVNFANAGALALFGRELVSMRYPLVALGIVQCAIVFALLLPIGPLAAAGGATTITALGFVQFLDPTAHWYALFLVILLAGVLHGAPPTARWRLDAIGAIVMTAVLFRQLSGVFIAMGVLTVLLLEPAPAEDAATHGRQRGSPLLARTLVGVMLAGLVGYLIRSTEEVGWLVFGIWPVLLLAWTGWTTRLSNAAVFRTVTRLARGGAVAALPLVTYHLVHGSLGAWYQDTIVTATQFPRMPFFDAMNYGNHVADALASAATDGLRGAVNGVFWAALTLVAAVVGALVLIRIARPAPGPTVPPPPALAVLAVFYAVVSVHYQIPIYLTYTAGLSLVALILIARGSRPVVVAAIALAGVGLYYHAGQPLSRGLAGTAAGERTALVEDDRLSRLGLRIEPADAELYHSVISLIEREVSPDARIFAVPSNAELYFLANRRNAFRFFNTALGVRSEADLAHVIGVLQEDPPVLVFYNRADKYNTPGSRAIMEHVAATYDVLPSIGPFEVYRRATAPVAAATTAQSSSK